MQEKNSSAGCGRKVIEIKDGVVRMPAWRMAAPVSFTLEEGEQMAVIGENGSGKSMFIDIVTGSHPLLMVDPKYDFYPSEKKLVSENIKYLTFRDSYGDGDTSYYLQQRWNQGDLEDDTPHVADLLEQTFLQTGADTPERRAMQKRLYDLFNIGYVLDKFLILLSSGELRKFQLIKTLMAEPRVLILDNPFIGLDPATRDSLRSLLATIIEERNIQIMLVQSRAEYIPDFITHVVEVKNMEVMPKRTLADFRASNDYPELKSSLSEDFQSAATSEEERPSIVKFNNVSIRYGERTILKDLDIDIRKGEHWALTGENGAGKSTLLSMVCADNPQSYACDISLFGYKRGTGESIWDIKKHIGYVSPEMHRAYNRDMPAIRIVASGLKDSVGLYVRPTEEDYSRCTSWMEKFGIAHLADKSFLKLSSGEQRLVLLARAFVKDPDLIILDEPLHGLDSRRCIMVKNIIDDFCSNPEKTMIMVTHYEEELPSCITNRIFLKRNV